VPHLDPDRVLDEAHDHLLVERSGDYVTVTMNRPERRNALSLPMVAAIVRAFDDLESDDGVGAVIVTGAPPAFCSGAVVSSLGRLASTDDDAERGSIVTVYDAFLRVLRSPLPTIAAVDGAAVGAGFNLALACDLRLAGPTARFESRFLRIGIHPGERWQVCAQPRFRDCIVLDRSIPDATMVLATCRAP